MKDIILTGPKHSGKTSTGKALALLCDCQFIDLDELVLQRTGKTPRQLYIESPAVFQKAEADAITAFAQELCSASGENVQWRVIAAGGGIIDNPEAIAVLKNFNATIVFLNAFVDTAWKRINNSADGFLPPGFGINNPQETHRELHEKRSDAYQQLADIVIFIEGKTPQEIAGEILELIE